MLNLHPALPGGPTGTWQEVIWELLRQESADETGAMIHLATAAARPRAGRQLLLVSASSAPTSTALWHAVPRQALERGASTRSPPPRARREPLFAEVRRRGERREIPLLYQTLRQFAEGRLNTCATAAVFAESARLPLDLYRRGRGGAAARSGGE